MWPYKEFRDLTDDLWEYFQVSLAENQHRCIAWLKHNMALADFGLLDVIEKSAIILLIYNFMLSST